MQTYIFIHILISKIFHILKSVHVAIHSKNEKAREDLEFLLNQVSEFDIRGDSVPSEVLVHGPLAFPIGATPDGKAFLAGAHYGQGRVIVATHEAFLFSKSLSTFFLNALQWLDKGRNGAVGIVPRLQNVTNLLSKSGLPCQVTDFKDDLSVYVCTSYSGDHCKEIQSFVAEGGGLLIGGHAWYWAYSNTAASALTKYPGNHILNQMGLSILPNTLEAGLYKVQPVKELVKVYQFRQFLTLFVDSMTQSQSLNEDQKGCLQKMGRDCAKYLTMSAHDCASYSSVLEILTDLVKTGKVPQVCGSCPVRSTEDRLLLEVASGVCKVCPDPGSLLPYIIKDLPALPTVSNAKLCISASTAGQFHHTLNTEMKTVWSVGNNIIIMSPRIPLYLSFPLCMVAIWQMLKNGLALVCTYPLAWGQIWSFPHK